MATDQDTIEHRRAIVRKHNQKRQARSDMEIQFPTEKRCVGCSETKPAAAFSIHRLSKDGLRPRCKVCIAREHAAKQDALGRKRKMSASLRERLGIEVPAPPVEDTPDGPIMRVPLSKGGFTVIDAADWPLVSKHNWHLTESGYVVTNGVTDTWRGLIYLHVMLHGAVDGHDVDHRDLEKLNNRRGNLRTATRTQNHANKIQRSDARSSQFKGVRQLPSGGWQARIVNRGLGTFGTEQEAAAAYDKAARDVFGEFARANFAA